MKKICFISSSGGHFEQLLQLEEIIKDNDSFIVTERTKYSLSTKHKIFYLIQLNRKSILTPLILIINSIKSIYILLKEKPKVIITTGALVVIPFCLIGKLLKVNLIFIESYAKVNSKSKTGSLLNKYADRFYVQWPNMIKLYANAIYKGGIY